MAYLGWQQFIDAGLTVVDQLTDREDLHERWLVRAPSGSCLVVVEVVFSGLAGGPHLRVLVYEPAFRPDGGTVSMRAWRFLWERIFEPDEVSLMLREVADMTG